MNDCGNSEEVYYQPTYQTKIKSSNRAYFGMNMRNKKIFDRLDMFEFPFTNENLYQKDQLPFEFKTSQCGMICILD